ncbi:plasma membrane amino acid transmembrane transporter Aat1 [Schizosaccharomyces pombe]|uniref:Amino acid transporter 1 n=1 Tax=Schizosaccharomyces pombe (strain 972 / ATCC 24843) TaxID=284812 RepID=AAT1_SCHPO|nr:amino acid permease [Schizosaccharomyces pombe]Q9P5N2.1 RecName: Full=Amino acid transporter 1 [Schizosaccharomyces pombe 972h-]CAB91572.1 amino acid transporter Aat1 (predicted) [Schizosaccharomyces pombe]|eukprot:NP_595053.1 amino acid permease [Schizosaccharomyces pombe]
MSAKDYDFDIESVLPEEKAPQVSEAKKDYISQESTVLSGQVDFVEPEHKGFFQNLIDGFKPAREADGNGGPALKRGLSTRHMQLMSIGGAIGSGLYVGSGSALADGGPASVIINYILIGIMMFFVIYALGEMAVAYPVAGSFNTYATRFIDPAWGFAVSWNYFFNYFVTFPFELTTCAITFTFWTDVNCAVWISIFLVVVIGINLFGVRVFGEVEFVLALIKVVATVGFIILAIIINCGGVPTDHRGYIGGSIIKQKPFRHGFKGFCSVYTTAAFSFSGTEIVGLAAAEVGDPRKTLPGAVKQVFWRVAIFYIVSLILIGLLISPDDPKLMGNGSASVSPFVLAIQEANIKGLPSVFNAVIIISVISVTNSSTYTAGRTLHGMANLKQAPAFFKYTDRLGRPLIAMIVVLSFGFFAYINEANNNGNDISDTVFDWLLAISGLSNFFTWGSICLSHIMFRLAFKKQGHSLKELGFVSPMGIWGSVIGLGFNILCLMAEFYVSLFPIGGSPNANDFFQGYLAACITLVFFIGYKIYDRSHIPSLDKLDITTGLKTYEYEETKDSSDTGRFRFFKKIINTVC